MLLNCKPSLLVVFPSGFVATNSFRIDESIMDFPLTPLKCFGHFLLTVISGSYQNSANFLFYLYSQSLVKMYLSDFKLGYISSNLKSPLRLHLCRKTKSNDFGCMKAVAVPKIISFHFVALGFDCVQCTSVGNEDLLILVAGLPKAFLRI